MQPTQVDPQSLAEAAQAIGQCAMDMGNGLTQLQTTVTSNHPWGGDEPGSLFGAAYVEVLGHALDVYGSHAQMLGDAANGLADWAVSAAQSDQAAAEHFARLQARLGG